jgi:hypothetical protein
MLLISELCVIYPFSDPHKLLYDYSLDQLVQFREYGWKAKETEARLFWGILGEIMSGKKPKAQGSDNQGVTGLNEFKQAHPEAKNEGDAWKVSK